MSQHMVIFQNPDGDPGYNQFESIEDAVGFVEKLRNEQGIESIRIFELDEVKFDLKPVYKVELQALNPGAPAPKPPSAPQAAPAAPQPSAPAASPPPSAPPSSPEPTPSAAEPPSGSPFAPPSEPSSSEPAPAPSPPADQPSEDGQPARRGLFGR